jgi:hypothetical protein
VQRKGVINSCMSIYLFACLSIYPFVHLSVCMSVCLFICQHLNYLPHCPSNLTFYVSVCPSMHPSACPLFHLSFRLLVHLSIRLFACPSLRHFVSFIGADKVNRYPWVPFEAVVYLLQLTYHHHRS